MAESARLPRHDYDKSVQSLPVELDVMPVHGPAPAPSVEEGALDALERFEVEEERRIIHAWHRFRGDYRKTPMPSLWMSLKGLNGPTRAGLLNVFLITLPVAWALHFVRNKDGSHFFGASTRFSVNLVAIIPLQKRFEWLGEEMIPYVGAELGELLTITLSNTVEASLSIGLLARNNYRLLQITAVGVILLHILFVPGVNFFMGGARIIEQELHSGKTQINHTLLTFGVMALVVPAAFFSALDRGNLRDLTEYVTRLNESAGSTEAEDALIDKHPELGPLLTDTRRGQFLQMSRGMSILLLACYVGARVYVHNPPGKGNALSLFRPENAPSRLRQQVMEKENRESAVSPWFGVCAILLCVAFMAVTAQFLVGAAEELLRDTAISQEWFGLVLLPWVSYAGDAILSILHWRKKYLSNVRHHMSSEPDGVASGLSIDLSIQFLLFWLPLLVLLAWWTHKPLSLVLDVLEVALLVAACFLVNYVTADAKTNWAEGLAMVMFYTIIALAAWFYPGQQELRIFVGSQSVAESLANGPPGE